MMPIQIHQTQCRPGDLPPCMKAIPFAMFDGLDHRCKENHCGQDLDKIAERSGFGPEEALWVLRNEDLDLKAPTDTRAAKQELMNMVSAWLRVKREKADAALCPECGFPTSIFSWSEKGGPVYCCRLCLKESALKTAKEQLEKERADWWDQNGIPCAACGEMTAGKTALTPLEGEDGLICAVCMMADFRILETAAQKYVQKLRERTRTNHLSDSLKEFINVLE